MHVSTEVKDIEHAHSPEEIAKRLEQGPQANYLRDWVFGGIDGAVTTFAIVAGVAGAALSTNVILILGAANLLADGFSMAAGNYSGVKAERDDYNRLREMELRHIAVAPEGEREEVRQIFAAKGFDGEDLERAVDVITSCQERWVKVMLEEERRGAESGTLRLEGRVCYFCRFFCVRRCSFAAVLIWRRSERHGHCNGDDRRDLFRHRRHEVQMVDLKLVVFRPGNAHDRHDRCGSRLWRWGVAEKLDWGVKAPKKGAIDGHHRFNEPARRSERRLFKGRADR